MRLYILFLCTFFASVFFVKAQSYFSVPNIKDTTQFKKGVARTAWLLTSGNKGNPHSIKILVYGQSISEQNWWKDVRDFVESRFPLAHITFINKAIGGFSSERLKLMVENDVVSLYPDLILFHDYGNEEDYETIIQTIRRRTTAEIAVQTDHIAAQNQEWHDKHNQKWLPSICNKYDLALIDVRSIWKTYLKENDLDLKDLLVDGVHLNAHGNYLMASIIKKYFASLSEAEAADRSVKNMASGKDFSVKGNKIDIPVNGNRIDVVWKPSVNRNRQVLVYIDEKRPSAFNTCYYYTRPAFDSTSFLKKIGQVLAMKLTDKAKEEDWMMTITWVDSVRQQIGFSLKGSLTGKDGSGSSDSTFTSQSGKIIIEPTFWFRAKEFAKFPWVKPGDVLQWQIRSMCRDEVIPEPSATTTVAQGLVNGQHKLELTGKALNNIQAIKVYQPPLK